MTESDIKITYRKTSLLIHPDKTKNPQAPEAFDRLKKAQTELVDEKHRTRLDEAISDARMLLMRENKWTADSPETRTEEFKKQWADKTKYVLIDNEQRRRRQVKAQMQEEGREQRREDEEVEARKRKRQHEQGLGSHARPAYRQLATVSEGQDGSRRAGEEEEEVKAHG